MADASNPVPPPEPYHRIDSLDLIRGVAILGILIMNVYSMALPHIAYSAPRWTENSTAVDTAIYVFQSLAVESRLMSVFTMLFGVGLMLQSDRFRAGDLDPKPRLRRRLAWLLVFGLVHGFLLWHGDILTLYALAGFLVLPATRWSARRLVVVGVILISVGQIFLLLVFAGSLVSGANLMEVPELPFDGARVAAARQVWTTFPDRLGANAREFARFLLIFPFMMLWHTAGVMMVGMALYRRGFFSDPKAWRRGFPTMALGAVIGAVVLRIRFVVGINTSAGQSLVGVMMIAGILMAIGYMSLLIPAASGTGLLVRALKNTGKTAFTLYVSQTVVTLILFVGVLRPAWGSWGRGALLGYVVVFSVLQVMYAHRRQERVGRGPLESLWRRLAAAPGARPAV
ncbi:MAG: DUF418 domain-containing protein [Spirochaetaceae bacterium]